MGEGFGWTVVRAITFIVAMGIFFYSRKRR
jgi:hypothetical protein